MALHVKTVKARGQNKGTWK